MCSVFFPVVILLVSVLLYKRVILKEILSTWIFYLREKEINLANITLK